METVIKLPAYTTVPVEVDSPESLVAALHAVAKPKPKPRPAPAPRPDPKPVERYFRYISRETAYVVTLTQMQDRFARSQRRDPALVKPHLLDWAEQAAIGDRYTGHLTVICISNADATRQEA